MRTVTIEKTGNNYTVNPNASENNSTAYAWIVDDTRDPGTNFYSYFNVETSPENPENLKHIYGNFESGIGVESFVAPDDMYVKISDTSFSVSWDESGTTVTQTFTRDSTKDITLWVVS